MELEDFLNEYLFYSPEQLVRTLSLRGDWVKHCVDLPEETLYALADYRCEWIFRIPDLPHEVKLHYVALNPRCLPELSEYTSDMVCVAIKNGGSGIVSDLGDMIHPALAKDILKPFLEDAVHMRRTNGYDNRTHPSSYPMFWATTLSNLRHALQKTKVPLTMADVKFIPTLLATMEKFDFTSPFCDNTFLDYDNLVGNSLVNLLDQSPVSARAYVPSAIWFDLV